MLFSYQTGIIAQDTDIRQGHCEPMIEPDKTRSPYSPQVTKHPPPSDRTSDCYLFASYSFIPRFSPPSLALRFIEMPSPRAVPAF